MTRLLPASFFFLGIAGNVALLPAQADERGREARGPAKPLSVKELVEQLVQKADAGEAAAGLAQQAGERGMEAALEAAAALDRGKPRRCKVLYETIAVAGRARRSHEELLKLYDPAAYRVFYSKEGLADQKKIASGLSWPQWPDYLPEAVVRAAPVPALEWLGRQSASPAPPLEQLQAILRQWGWWVRTGNERQHHQALARLAGSLASNPALRGTPSARAAFLRFLSDTACKEALDFVVESLEETSAEVRGEACRTLGRIGGAAALDALLRLAARESDTHVLEKLTVALEAWQDSPEVGDSMLALFQRTDRDEVRRAILYTAAQARWPQRAELILRAFDSPGAGVPGVALDALAQRAIPESLPKTLALLESLEQPQPQLVDALGALGDPRAVPHLVRWLERETHAPLRLKIAWALENTPGEEAHQAILELLAREKNPLTAEHVVAIAGRLRLPAAVPLLISLAEDTTAPFSVRIQAIAALGQFDLPQVRERLNGLGQQPEKHFAEEATPESADLEGQRVELARLFVALARLRLGEPEAAAELQRLYERAGPAVKLHALLQLAEARRDHPIIAQGLDSADFVVLLAAVRAAGAASPRQYHRQLVAMQRAPFLSALLSSGLDILNFKSSLEEAIQAGRSL